MCHESGVLKEIFTDLKSNDIAASLNAVEIFSQVTSIHKDCRAVMERVVCCSLFHIFLHLDVGKGVWV